MNLNSFKNLRQDHQSKLLKKGISIPKYICCLSENSKLFLAHESLSAFNAPSLSVSTH